MDQVNGRWLSVSVRSGEEFDAAADLSRSGFEVFLPWQMVERRVHRRGLVHARSERAARFTGYMFALVDTAHSVWSLRRGKGVIDVVNHRGQALPIAGGVMAAMRSACTWDGYWPPERAATEVALGPPIGSVVLITEGPFMGFPGVVEAVDIRANRMVLSVSIFGRSTRVECPITAADATQSELVG